MDESKNPWITKSSKTIYENPWIKVREDQVIRPDGNPGIYGVVETRLAVGVLALEENEDVWLVGQYRYTLDKYSWEIIEGGAEGEESAEETARRELEEEAGLLAESLEKLCPDVHLSNCISNERAVFYVATGLSRTTPKPDPTEQLELKKVSFDKALAMVRSGEITDSMSVIAIMSYAQGR